VHFLFKAGQAAPVGSFKNGLPETVILKGLFLGDDARGFDHVPGRHLFDALFTGDVEIQRVNIARHLVKRGVVIRGAFSLRGQFCHLRLKGRPLLFQFFGLFHFLNFCLIVNN